MILAYDDGCDAVQNAGVQASVDNMVTGLRGLFAALFVALHAEGHPFRGRSAEVSAERSPSVWLAEGTSFWIYQKRCNTADSTETLENALQG